MRRPHPWSMALYLVALFLYPPAFRREFGPELRRDMHEALGEAWQRAGWRGLMRLWATVAIDLLVSVPSQWARAKWRAATVLVPIASAASLATSGHGYVIAWQRAAIFRDDEMALLLVAVSTVLLLLVCTLTFTLAFARRRVLRRR